jgi:hypothetical protein
VLLKVTVTNTVEILPGTIFSFLCSTRKKREKNSEKEDWKGKGNDKIGQRRRNVFLSEEKNEMKNVLGTRVSNTWPADRMWPARCICAAREHLKK